MTTMAVVSVIVGRVSDVRKTCGTPFSDRST